MAIGRIANRGTKHLAAAALGIGVVAGSLLGGFQAAAAPQGGARGASARLYACWCEPKVTTTNLNLRKGPGTNYEILYVMPKGLEVQADLGPDMHQNGFVHVSWDDGENYGWASEQYLADAGTQTGGYPLTGTAFTTDRVNFRHGPGVDYYVQEVLDAGTEVEISDEVVDGFRYVRYVSTDGWIADDYLDVSDGASYDQPAMTTSTRLNLRVGASLESDVLVVMPEGATVYPSDLVVNGFRKVVYGSYEGWAYDAYLQ